MPAPPVIRGVYAQLLAREGEPNRTIAFENGPPGAPERIDVFVWEARDDDDVTIFNTVGMAALPMQGGSRAELRWVIRGRFDDRVLGACATFLANLALYPFQRRTHFDWGHKVRQPVPQFPSSAGCWFHPPFVPSGLGGFRTPDGDVKLLYVVPVTQAEAQMSNQALAEHLQATGIDVFRPR